MNRVVRAWLAAALLMSAGAALRAADAMPPPPVDNDTSPFHLALLAYKAARYDDALKSVNEAEAARPGDPTVEILKAHILMEQGNFTDGEKVLKKLIASGGGYDAQNVLGDLYLRARRYADAIATYNACLAQKPGNPDLLLDLIYANIGNGDLVTAGKYYSQLSPFDPDHPCYYFAKAALAQATGKGGESDDDIETARTIYGITVANRYTRTYLQFTSATPLAASRAEPPPASASTSNTTTTNTPVKSP